MPTLLACGSNGSGQLALGHAEDVSSLSACVFDPACPRAFHVVDLVSSASHALLLVQERASDGGSERTHLLGAGTTTHGQLGLACALGPATPAPTFRPVSIARDAGLGDEWRPVKIAATWTTSIVVYERKRPAAGSAARDTDMATGVEQVVVAAGSNDFGELGTPPSSPAVVRVPILHAGEHVHLLAGGQRHVVAVLTGPSGVRVVGWGAARRGELSAVPLGNARKVPVVGGKNTSKGKGKATDAKSKGKAAARAPTSTPVEIALSLDSTDPPSALALGSAHSLLLADGRVRAWGSDLKGQTTDLDNVPATSIAASWGGSYLLSNGVWSQGANTHGQLLRTDTADDGASSTNGSPTANKETLNAGHDRTSGRALIPLPPDTAPTSLVAGTEHILVVAEQDGRDVLLAGGWNEHGNLGLGDLIDRDRLVRVPVPLASSTGPAAKLRVWAGCAATWVLVEDEES